MTQIPRIIDSWMQHPTPRLIKQPMFESLLRWGRDQPLPEEIPLEMTIGSVTIASSWTTWSKVGLTSTKPRFLDSL